MKNIITELNNYVKIKFPKGKQIPLTSAHKLLQQLLRKYPKNGNMLFGRDELIGCFQELSSDKTNGIDERLAEVLKLKPTRTLSGVTPITVLTKPFPCPGKCIFCPNDIRMPKSYIASEPGAQRAGHNAFDPYLQTYNRLLALTAIGHRTNKAELIVLGGTWSFYPEDYQIWFIKRCFDALNDFGNKDDRPELAGIDFKDSFKDSQETVNYNAEINKQSLKAKNLNEISNWEELETAQIKNETADCRCVGLVLETRPDFITEKEVIKLRRLGATKVQIGIQSLNQKVLDANQRGTTIEQLKTSFKLLRLAGFKIHGHLMPNLYQATVASDKQDYLELWQKDYCPDELKIYPTSIIKGTLLYKYFQEGNYRPYDNEELVDLLQYCFQHTPRYCRLSRVIRDIPSNEISAGNKTTNLRQIVELSLDKQGKSCQCIRCREVKGKEISWAELELENIEFTTSTGSEHFISYKTSKEDKIAGFLRLSLSDKKTVKNHFIPEISDCAMIREVHVYGKVTELGSSDQSHTQHLGIGSKLIRIAEAKAKAAGFSKIAVISAIGTRNYYSKFGYELQGMYQVKAL